MQFACCPIDFGNGPHIHTPANAILAESRQSRFTLDCSMLAIDFGQVTQACGPKKEKLDHGYLLNPLSCSRFLDISCF